MNNVKQVGVTQLKRNAELIYRGMVRVSDIAHLGHWIKAFAVFGNVTDNTTLATAGIVGSLTLLDACNCVALFDVGKKLCTDAVGFIRWANGVLRKL